jgi:hypothetical protein
MAIIGNLIVRLISISFGFLLAIVAAGLFVSFGLYNDILGEGGLLNHHEEDLFAFISIVFGFGATLLIGYYSVGLVAILIAIAELMRWKGLVTNLVMGGACAGFLAIQNFDFVNQSGEASQPPENYGALLVALSAGFIAGFVYWLIAGHRAGDWLGPVNPKQMES